MNAERRALGLPEWRDNNIEGSPPITAHGFRSTFKSWCQDNGSWADELSEAQLAHTAKDKTRSAYARSKMVDRRRSMMEAWNHFCDGKVHTADVISLRPTPAVVTELLSGSGGEHLPA
jgi:integrase